MAAQRQGRLYTQRGQSWLSTEAVFEGWVKVCLVGSSGRGTWGWTGEEDWAGADRENEAVCQGNWGFVQNNSGIRTVMLRRCGLVNWLFGGGKDALICRDGQFSWRKYCTIVDFKVPMIQQPAHKIPTYLAFLFYQSWASLSAPWGAWHSILRRCTCMWWAVLAPEGLK